MKASLSPNLVLCIEAESDSEVALLRMLGDHHITENSFGVANHEGPLEGGRHEYRTYKFQKETTTMKDLNELQIALDYLPHCRSDRIRDVTRAGPLTHFKPAEGHIIQAINGMWDLICDSAETRIKAAIRAEAQRMKEEAEKALL